MVDDVGVFVLQMKQFFSRDSKKGSSKKGMVKEETLRARYTEYKGSRENLDAPIYKKQVNDLHTVSKVLLSLRRAKCISQFHNFGCFPDKMLKIQ